MRFTFLGTGAAEGYPALFCNCVNCSEARRLGGPNLRKRSAALINDDLLIDLGPDLIASIQQFGIDLTTIRYILQTHSHSDHLDANNITCRLPGYTSTQLPPVEWYAGETVFAAAAHMLWQEQLSHEDLAAAKLSLHPVEPGRQFEVGPYRVSSIPATHGGENEPCMLHLIGDGRSTIFYCTDTGPLSEEAWRLLHADGRVIDLVAMDETMGIGGEPDPEHLNMESFLQQLERMRAEGLLAPTARIFAHHISHERNPIHPKLSEIFAPYGVEIPYDGLTIEL